MRPLRCTLAVLAVVALATSATSVPRAQTRTGGPEQAHSIDRRARGLATRLRVATASQRVVAAQGAGPAAAVLPVVHDVRPPDVTAATRPFALPDRVACAAPRTARSRAPPRA